MKIHAMLFAGGTGQRMGGKNIPKQFIDIEGKPIIVRTVENFSNHPLVDDIVIACIESGIDYMNELISRFNLAKVKAVIPGGKTGFQSIHNGIIEVNKEAEPDDIILICDGVRPILKEELITECIELTKEQGTAVPVVRAIDSVFVSEDGLSCNVSMPREKMFITQAPQGYTMKKILWAHNEAEKRGIKDPISSADLMIMLGEDVRIFMGDRNNIKATTPEDLHTLRSHYYYEHYMAFAQEEFWSNKKRGDFKKPPKRKSDR